MRKDTYLELDKENIDLNSLILHCLLDESKLRNIRVSVKSDNIKVWIYHKIPVQKLKEYENQYNKEIKFVESLLKIKK